MIGSRQTYHRWSERQPIAMEVKLASGDEAPLHGSTQNVGLGGMLVELGASRLYPNVQVIASFPLAPSNPAARRQLLATVVWTSGSKVGLMFDDFNPDTLRSIRDVL